MSEALINWFMVTLGGKVGKEFILFLISMVPILELRGGLLAAGPGIFECGTCKSSTYLCDWKSCSNSIYPFTDYKDL